MIYNGTTAIKPRIKPQKKYVADGYFELDYIESTGTQYIDTNYIAKPTTATEMKFSFTEVSTRQQRLWGTYETDSTGGLVFDSYINGSGYIAYAFQNDSGNWVSLNTTANTNTHIYKMDGKNSSYYIDGSKIASLSGNPTYNSKSTLRLLSNYISDNPKAKGKLIYSKIWDNGVLVRDYKPAKRENDGIVGMYDLVNDVFYTSQGTEEFIAGNEILLLTEEIRRAYVENNLVYGNRKLRLSTDFTKSSVNRGTYSACGSNTNYAIECGGDNGSNTIATCDVWNTNLVRSAGTDLSKARRWSACATVNENIIVTSGATDMSQANRVTTTDVYNATCVRSTVTGLSSAGVYMGAGANSNYAIFAGGYRNGYSAVVDSYSKTLVKSTATSLSNAKEYPSGGNLNENIMICGGSTYSSCDVYNASLTKSTTTLSVGRRWSGIASTNKYLICAGGYKSSGTSDVVDAFNTSLVRSTITPLSNVKGGMAGTDISKKYMVVGGGWSNANNYIEIYDDNLTKKIITLPEIYQSRKLFKLKDKAVFLATTTQGYLVNYTY